MTLGKPTLLVLVLALFAALLDCAEPQTPALEVTPGELTLTSGATVPLTVTRRFPGGAVDDVTNRVAYSTSDKLIATVNAYGVLTAGQNAGSVLVRAYDPTSDATGVTTFTVVEPKILSIDVEPSAIALTLGAGRQLSATASYSNDLTKDVTTQVLWSSVNEAIATVDAKGNVTPVSPGETDVVAKDATTGVTGRSSVFVLGASPVLLALSVTPNPGLLAVGKTLQLKALGVLSDGTTRDVTTSVTWTSAVPAVATIDAAGLATGVAAGQTTFTAAGPEPSSGVLGSAAATVTP